MLQGGRTLLLLEERRLAEPTGALRAGALDASPRSLLDPNTWSKDGTIALGGLGFSDDGRYVAYSRAEAGSDWSTSRVLEIASGKVLPDELRWTKFSQASWTKDGEGFFYSRYEEPKKGAEFQALNFNNQVFYHRLGTVELADALVYFRPEHREWQYETEVTDNGRWLVIATHLGTDERNRVTIKDLSRARREVHRTDRQLRARVHAGGQRWVGAVLQDGR